MSVEEVLCEAQSAKTQQVTLVDVLRFLVVSVYLGIVFLLLVAVRRVRPGNPLKSIPRWVIGKFRAKQPNTR